MMPTKVAIATVYTSYPIKLISTLSFSRTPQLAIVDSVEVAVSYLEISGKSQYADSLNIIT